MLYFPEQQKWINPEPLNLEPLNAYAGLLNELRGMKRHFHHRWAFRSSINQNSLERERIYGNSQNLLLRIPN